MKQGLSLGFSQSLTLTPQLQQSIRLLQLSSLELEQEVEQQLATNPFLARDDEVSERERFDYAEGSDEAPLLTADELDWDGDGTVELAPNDSEWGVEAQSHSQTHASQYVDGDVDPFGRLTSATSLSEHLKRQAQHLRLCETDVASLHFLIDSLDERGFLTESLDELAACLSSDPEDVARLVDQLRIARQWLLHLEPCGVGAQDVGECLRMQLRAAEAAHTGGEVALYAAAKQLLNLPLSVLAKRNVLQLVASNGFSESLIQQGLQLISTFEPLPSRRFIPLVDSVVVPDVYVYPIKRKNADRLKFEVELNTDVMPKLKVDEVTAQLLKLQKAREKAKADGKHTATEVMQQTLAEARGFIKSLTQRFDTILRVAKAIVSRQEQFLQHGAVAMRPLVLRDIADELGLHESTVSRVTTSKYMATPQGTFEFKYFFDTRLGTDSGGETSGTAVRALIAQFIAAENKSKPLSDGKIADLLAAQGIACARRTVAKYREALRIPTASLRKM
ncbi:MAG: RNA polymerase factor sigma-54 [Cytophagales bacterium]|nr:RNA polymerase factor sigma-54 [Cytophagales bacterium]